MTTNQKTPHLNANLNLETGNFFGWIAARKSEELQLPSFVSDSWTSDKVLDPNEVLSRLTGTLIHEDYRMSSKQHNVVVVGEQGIVSISYDRRQVTLGAYATNHQDAKALVNTIKEILPTTIRKANLLDVTFWYDTKHGPRSYERQLQVPAWQTIKENYTNNTRESLENIIEPDLDRGKLILWQGEPGTGKTWALRALGQEWANWCRVHYVIDPEKFFAEGDYLLTVVLGESYINSSDEETTKPDWRLVVLEDCGEILAKDAKLQTGQGLSRLLNLCDGLIGQGLRVLMLITTNEQIGSLHQAVSRPGRCLSKTVFEKFSIKEAGQWLKEHNAETDNLKAANLAELYAQLKGDKIEKTQTRGFVG